MKPGKQFEVKIKGKIFSVLYTPHFVQRFELGDPTTNRLPVKKFVSEETVRHKIEEAMPTISEITAVTPNIQGVIKSKKTKANMVFITLQTQKGWTIAMKTIVVRVGFKPISLSDYVVEINPLITVRFRRGLSSTLKEMVVDDLIQHIDELEDKTLYHLRGEYVDYYVERSGDSYFVEEASWIHDIYEIKVA